MNRIARSVPRPRVGVEILVLLLLAGSEIAVGYWFYAGQKRAIELDVHEHLREITQLKVSEIAAWRAERLGDANVARTILRLLPGTQQEIEGGDNPKTKRELSQALDSIRQNYQYANVVVMDASGKIRLISGQLLGPPRVYEQLAREASGSESMVIREFPPGAGVSKPHFVLAAGLTNPLGKHVGTLLLGVDPAIYLYPVVLHWPSPTRTGQVVLLRRDKNDAIFLSDLEGVPGAIMKLRRSFTSRSALSVRTVLGETQVDGRISNGELVEGAGRQVPGSDWFVLATIHADEAYQPLAQVRTGLWIVGGLLLLVFAAGIEAIRRRQLSKFYRQQYQTEVEKQALLGHYDYVAVIGVRPFNLPARPGLVPVLAAPRFKLFRLGG